MMSSYLRPALRAASIASGARSFSSTAPAEATLREIETRIKSVRNIGKITSSMKMVAAARLPAAQRARSAAVAYGKSSQSLSKSLDLDNVAFKDLPYDKETFPDARELVLPASSDRGLSGAIHSGLAKATRLYVDRNAEQGIPTDIGVLGEKPRAQLARVLSGQISFAFTGIGKGVPTFDEALAIARTVNQADANYARITIIYNSFASAIANELVTVSVYPPQIYAQSEEIQRIYDVSVEPSATEKGEPQDNTFEALDSVADYQLANAIYTALVDGFCAEMSARRNAMDNASKNAGEMIEKLQMQYNRMRQSAITNELVDIITGASAL